MNWIHPTALLLGTWGIVFLEASSVRLHGWLQAQPDLLPALVVYAALYSNLPTTAAVAILGGLGSDTFSSGPLGLGVVPLLVLGVLLHQRRDVILRDSAWAQASLGAVASGTVWLAGFLLVFVLWPFASAGASATPYWPEVRGGLGALPDMGLGRLWQWLVATGTGLVGTPLLFRCFRWVDGTFNYQPAPVPHRYLEREIERGRN